ncbi:MAG: hypothetical protein E6I24_10240 [Chloroflexi bacterium]|nr:MAG: hypothetical protein E6I24_10240 [Chloroflexota bacterium]
MSKLVRAALIIPTLAILAVSSATVAMADNGVNLSVEPNATLTARLEVQMTMTASCPTGAYTMGSNVIVEQAIGKSIAHGTGYLPYFQCTGADQVLSVMVLADPSGLPFKKGTAIVSASFFAYDYTTNTSGVGSVITTLKLK